MCSLCYYQGCFLGLWNFYYPILPFNFLLLKKKIKGQRFFFFLFFVFFSFFCFLLFCLIEIHLAYSVHIFTQFCVTLRFHFNPSFFLFALLFLPVRPVVIDGLSDGGVSHPFFDVIEPTLSVIVNLSFPAPEISLNEDDCPLSVDLLRNSFDGIVKNRVGLVLEVVLPPLLQKEMENGRIVHSIVTSLEVIPCPHLMFPLVAEVMLLDNRGSSIHDVAK